MKQLACTVIMTKSSLGYGASLPSFAALAPSCLDDSSPPPATTLDICPSTIIRHGFIILKPSSGLSFVIITRDGWIDPSHVTCESVVPISREVIFVLLGSAEQRS
eukprot:CCRYP_013655-RB/>CCRYP_013655-RB protein AED:0.43 eAED:0.43 QI:406/0/0.66/1/0/0/3/0/104